MRRHDYTVDILGGATGANYALDYKSDGQLPLPGADTQDEAARPVASSIGLLT
jgi:hypothetical protein